MEEQISVESGINYRHERYAKLIWKNSDGTFAIEGRVGNRKFEAGPFQTLEDAQNDGSEDEY